jgi:hypothetical protein
VGRGDDDVGEVPGEGDGFGGEEFEVGGACFRGLGDGDGSGWGGGGDGDVGGCAG